MAICSSRGFGCGGLHLGIYFCILVAHQIQMCLSSTITAVPSSKQDHILRRQETTETGNPGYPVLLGYFLGFDYTCKYNTSKGNLHVKSRGLILSILCGI
jgi:hypothetical protein